MTACEARIAVTSAFINALVSKNLLAPLLTGDRYVEKKAAPLSSEDIKSWVTINGAKVPLGEGGVLIGSTGEKISEYSQKGIDIDENLLYNKKEGIAGKCIADFNSFIDKQKDMPNDYKVMLKARFAEGSPLAQEVFTKFVKNNIVVDTEYPGTPHFSPPDTSIKMNYSKDIINPKTPGTTYFHEHGHYIDYISVGGIGRASTSVKTTAKDGNFGEALRNDFTTFLETYKKENGISLDFVAYAYVRMELKKDEHRNSAASDLMGGLTNNKIKGGYGHDKEYWNPTQHTLEKEAFAHMTEAQFSENRYAVMKKYFPTALTEYERILRGLTL